MKVFLINRSDVLFFSGETKLKVKKENGREFIDIRADPAYVLHHYRCRHEK